MDEKERIQKVYEDTILSEFSTSQESDQDLKKWKDFTLQYLKKWKDLRISVRKSIKDIESLKKSAMSTMKSGKYEAYDTVLKIFKELKVQP